MENKKFKLCSENLDVVALMQQMVYINLEVYKTMKNKDFTDEVVRNEFELRCEKYLRLHESFGIKEWICYFSDLKHSLKINKYIVQGRLTTSAFHLIINLEKDYKECAKVGLQVFDTWYEPVTINIFNVEFIGD